MLFLILSDNPKWSSGSPSFSPSAITQGGSSSLLPFSPSAVQGGSSSLLQGSVYTGNNAPQSLTVYTNNAPSVHRLVPNKANSCRKMCVFCQLNKTKTKSGWLVYSRCKCDVCDVALCKRERGCFQNYHNLVFGEQNVLVTAGSVGGATSHGTSSHGSTTSHGKELATILPKPRDLTYTSPLTGISMTLDPNRVTSTFEGQGHRSLKVEQSNDESVSDPPPIWRYNPALFSSMMANVIPSIDDLSPRSSTHAPEDDPPALNLSTATTTSTERTVSPITMVIRKTNNNNEHFYGN